MTAEELSTSSGQTLETAEADSKGGTAETATFASPTRSFPSASATTVDSLLVCLASSKSGPGEALPPLTFALLSGLECKTQIIQMSRQGNIPADLHICTRRDSLPSEQSCGSILSDHTSAYSSLSSYDEPSEVILRVYRRPQSTWRGRMLNFVFHSTVVYYGVECSFTKLGAQKCDAVKEGWELFQSISMGNSIVPAPFWMDEMLLWIDTSYGAGTYRYFSHNCNDYASELCWALAGQVSPDWINQPARDWTRRLCLSVFQPLPYAFTHRPIVTHGGTWSPTLHEQHPPTPCPTPSTAAAESDTPSSRSLSLPELAAGLAHASPACMSHDSQAAPPPVPESTPVLPDLLTTPTTAIPQQETTTSTCHNTLPSNDVVSPSSPPTIPETAPSVQLPISQPQTSVEPPPAPTPQSSSAPPKPTAAWRHRPNCVKHFVPKQFMQKVAHFLCCGRAGVVNDDN